MLTVVVRHVIFGVLTRDGEELGWFHIDKLQYFSLQCFDIVGWAMGRSSGLYLNQNPGFVKNRNRTEPNHVISVV